jgi:serine/threonine-protein kinase
MGDTAVPAQDHEARLDAAIVAYLEAIEAGQTPEPEHWLETYPDLQDDLREFFANQQHVGGWTDSLRSVVRAARRETGVLDPEGPRHAKPLPQDFGDYELLDEIGRGGMGVVYQARQKSLQRLVALKMIRTGALASEADVRRFRHEAATAALLDHPHIVPIYEVGEWAGQPYFSMKWIAGGSLAQKQTGAPWDPLQAARFVAILSRAVAHAHHHGVVHRDLKPANVLLTADGAPQIGDFGLAKRGDTAGLTLDSLALLGTPSYMAPEQATGQLKLVGPHTDVHALGAILYELLTGRSPFRGATPLDTLDQVRSLEPVPPGRLQPKVPRDLEAVCLKCLQKEPARRYADGQALADDLARFLAGRPTVARPAGALSRAALWCRRPERVHNAGAFMVFLGLVLAAWCVWGVTMWAPGMLHSGQAGGFVRWLLLCIVGIYLPMAWLGRKIIQRRLVALWAGTLLTTGLLASTVAVQFTFTTPVDDVYEKGNSSRMATESLLIILDSIQLFACVTALMAYYSNRRAMRWSRFDAKSEPSTWGVTVPPGG